MILDASGKKLDFRYTFVCPKCGSHYFGSFAVSKPWENLKLHRKCHDEYGVGCEAVFTDDKDCFTELVLDE